MTMSLGCWEEVLLRIGGACSQTFLLSLPLLFIVIVLCVCACITFRQLPWSKFMETKAFVPHTQHPLRHVLLTGPESVVMVPIALC